MLFKIYLALIFSCGFMGFLGRTALAQSDFNYLVCVSVETRTLFLHAAGGDQEILAAYPIGVPKRNYYQLPLYGEITSIEFNPTWYPTEATRRAYFKKYGVELPKIIAPGDPRNAMGKVKINLLLYGVTEPIKVHCTNDPESIGKKVSRGCIRMFNENGLELAYVLRKFKTKIIFRE
ncbi:MAG: hypothetical protein CO140_00705 [Candidatus Moranbacteria bacterium CG_4_9_14_3_um_filter_40_7]|nr:MAG: hypothetical protein COS71_01165 [Candidatus Moranbacteria bacterium CG06_land_8_20_14_3_00_40_12]PJA88102.1 MAG: hypothetical protein CO140_00705 [Candidatus Moranbacteria bacterium CG_4_9_14_3_um_filter_40_7]